ncbi:MAG: hemerythrin-like metal-binding protein [Hyphomicrobiales bacterium]|nr:MAG: hemerythrin-like metal-binding protein [Hyphomicrobiales bacterium]
MLIEWRKDFETGVAEVDHEHQLLVDMLNRLHEEIGAHASKDRIVAFLGDVFARISAHFALEETVMRRRRYDDYAAHKTEHELLLDELADIMDRYERDAHASVYDELAGSVRDWFVNHFKTRDARLHRMLGV